MKADYAILINSTDSFEDCWHPFFKLFSKFWPNYEGKIYLNTETKDFKYHELDIVCIKNNISPPAKKNTWSERFSRRATGKGPRTLARTAQQSPQSRS